MSNSNTHQISLAVAIQYVISPQLAIVSGDRGAKVYIHGVSSFITVYVHIFYVIMIYLYKYFQNCINFYFCHIISRLRSELTLEVKKVVTTNPSSVSFLYTATNNLSDRVYTTASNSPFSTFTTRLGWLTATYTPYRCPAISGWFSIMCTHRSSVSRMGLSEMLLVRYTF